MIISKSNLQVIHVSGKDKDIDTLNNIHICKDGSTIGCAGNVVVFAVSPVRLQVKEKLKQFVESPLRSGVTFSIDFVKKLIKNMPKDVMFKGLLEHCDISDTGGANVEAVFHDGSSPFKVKGKKYKGAFAPFRKILKRILNSRDDKSLKVIVNRARLRLLLEAFDKAGSSNDQEVVFIEMTKDNSLILRGVNQDTGQRLLATMKTYEFKKERWLGHDRWEEKLKEDNKQKFIFRRNKRNGV